MLVANRLCCLVTGCVGHERVGGVCLRCCRLVRCGGRVNRGQSVRRARARGVGGGGGGTSKGHSPTHLQRVARSTSKVHLAFTTVFTSIFLQPRIPVRHYPTWGMGTHRWCSFCKGSDQSLFGRVKCYEIQYF